MTRITRKDVLLISYLRKDARGSLTSISRYTNIPISTLFDRLKVINNSFIKKNTCLLNFGKLGYDIRVTLLLKAHENSKDELRKYLEFNQNVNNMYRVSNGYDFLVEAVFKSLKEMDFFIEKLRSFNLSDSKEYFILEEVKRESFLADPSLLPDITILQ